MTDEEREKKIKEAYAKAREEEEKLLNSKEFNEYWEEIQRIRRYFNGDKKLYASYIMSNRFGTSKDNPLIQSFNIKTEYEIFEEMGL
ncbi:hypothetical protein [uncultured Brachyspira sp.]|uniref:hypothetical protein n=1 Tax=uncultured Brachyspira sp. TaxID=221953 RepID=UPI002617BF15|nr:hypothetical protein [uncultured Brachyspira sp.]